MTVFSLNVLLIVTIRIICVEGNDAQQPTLSNIPPPVALQWIFGLAKKGEISKSSKSK